MNLNQRLALLTDEEAERTLNGVLKVFIDGQEHGPELIKDEDSLREALLEMQRDAGLSQKDPDQLDTKNRCRLLRGVLVEMADDATLEPYLRNWLENARPSLLEPITTAIILTGLTLVLSAKFDVTYEDKAGKKHVKIKISKKPTAAGILTKLWGLLQ